MPNDSLSPNATVAAVYDRRNAEPISLVWRDSVEPSLSPSSTGSTESRPTTRVGMISLGCAKNLVDAEIMLGSVVARGMQITADANEADVLVVNTCAFIDSAKE